MKTKLNVAILLLCILCTKVLLSQKAVVSGYILDAKSGEILLNAICYDTLSYIGATSNNDGFFSLALPRTHVVLKASYIGYNSTVVSFDVRSDTLICFRLQPVSKELEEVRVAGELPLHRQTLIGKNTLSQRQIDVLPTFAGEVDLMKSISILPGVNLGREGYSNIYVRGGDRGQNLILYDGIKLYNTNHLGGLVSMFNPYVVKQVDVYKGGFPSQYGGRASSVIDVVTLDGNKEEIKGVAHIGLLSTGIALDGPIGSDVTYVFSGRTSFFDLLNIENKRKYNNRNEDVSYGAFTFFDLNGKLRWEISEKSNLKLSVFSGHDLQASVWYIPRSIHDRMFLSVNNTGLSLVNNMALKPRVFLKSQISYSDYKNSLENYVYNKQDTALFFSYSRVYDITLSSRVDFFAKGYTISTGVENTILGFAPGMQSSRITNKEQDVDTSYGSEKPEYMSESGVFVNVEKEYYNKLSVSVGIRAGIIDCADTVFFLIEPRLSIRWLVHPQVSFKANYTLMNQSIHVLVNNYDVFEKEIWIGASKTLLPQKSRQYSGGMFFSTKNELFEVSMETFYKTMGGLLYYTTPVADEYEITGIENYIVKQGKGHSFGLELGVGKKGKVFSVGANYTLSKSIRQFDALNNGHEFPFIYDKLHDFSAYSTFATKKRYSFNANFTLASGKPLTLPEAFIKGDGVVYDYYAYSGMFNSRFPTYHRLDVSIVRTEKTKRDNTAKFKINVYNVYARHNPVSVSYDKNSGKLYQRSLFTIIPSVSYSLEF